MREWWSKDRLVALKEWARHNRQREWQVKERRKRRGTIVREG